MKIMCKELQEGSYLNFEAIEELTIGDWTINGKIFGENEYGVFKINECSALRLISFHPTSPYFLT